MFDDFDLRTNVEEISGYDAEEAFFDWYQEEFSDYLEDNYDYSNYSNYDYYC